MKLKIEVGCLGALVAVLLGCGGSPHQTESIVRAIVTNPNCDSLRDDVWSELYRQVDLYGALPDAENITREVVASAKTASQGDAFARLYSEVSGSVKGMGTEAALQALAEMEIGDRTDERRSDRQSRVESALSEVKSESISALGECTSPDVSNPPFNAADSVPLFEGWRQSVGSVLYGAYKTFSVGYQSCNAVAVPRIGSATAPVSGIGITGTHSNGVGSIRSVTNASQIYATNPYYRSRSSPFGGCFATSDSPLIYDYGGKPYASATLGTLDLTKNGGTGSPALGIDCSGFVASAVLTGGLRLKSGVSSKAAQVSGVSASMLSNPASNGLSCFAPLASTKTQDLKAGDIVANTGHVFIIDQVGADPFGIRNANTAAACDAITSAGFNFLIIQSSASKGGIGMNRFNGADYLASVSSFRTGMLAYAKSFCKVRLGLAPSTTLANRSSAVIVRHKGTANCLNRRVALAGESCMKSCGNAAASSFGEGMLASLNESR